MPPNTLTVNLANRCNPPANTDHAAKDPISLEVERRGRGKLLKMASAHSPKIEVSFEFDEGRAGSASAIESLARSAQMTALQNPFQAASLPFFDAAKAADWFSGTSLLPVSMASIGPRAENCRRLRAIKYGSETLLENSYDPDGLLATVRYFDGETVSYDWDDIGRTLRVGSPSGHEVEIKLRGDDFPESIVYDKAVRFQYDYDLRAAITQICYPDGIRTVRTFGSRGELVTVTNGPLQVALDWNESLELKAFTIVHGDMAYEVSSQVKRVECDLTSSVLGTPSSSYRIHPLGAWVMNAEMALQEMLTPWGERFRVAGFGPNGPENVWSSAGMQYFHYDAAGSFNATTHPDGSRSVLYTLEGQPRALMVNPRGVTMLELDKHGRLCKVLGGDGRYQLIDYTREASVKRVASFTETFSVSRNKQGLIAAMRSDCGYTCELVYSNSGVLIGLVADGLRRNSADDISRMLKFLWKCLGLRTICSLVIA